MSSDEERILGQQKQYDIIEPVWRSDAVTAWLRVFDALHWNARRGGLFGDQRGAEPRMRTTKRKGNTNGRFVRRLPRSAYNDVWFNSQANAQDVVRPGPPVPYLHEGRIIE